MNEEKELRRIASTIREFGWQVISVPESGQYPAFAYSIGLTKTFQHPEILIVGLDIKLMHHLINDMGKMIIEGILFKDGDQHPNILLGKCLFSSVEEIYYREHFGHAISYYQGEDFQVLQCLWPTKKGLFPTDLGCPESFQNCQSLVPAGGNLSSHSHTFFQRGMAI